MEISWHKSIIETDGEMNMATQYTEEFKNDAVRYWKDHPKLGVAKCAKNLRISKTALSNWRKIYDTNEGIVPTRERELRE
jgi:transposase